MSGVDVFLLVIVAANAVYLMVAMIRPEVF
ncbi:MAG: potassium-transporting ATPase subunit F [Myxococcota bacterium]